MWIRISYSHAVAWAKYSSIYEFGSYDQLSSITSSKLANCVQNVTFHYPRSARNFLLVVCNGPVNCQNDAQTVRSRRTKYDYGASAEWFWRENLNTRGNTCTNATCPPYLTWTGPGSNSRLYKFPLKNEKS
jgi:hypothetical protein